MSWRTWLAEKIAPVVKQAEGEAVAVVQSKAPGLSARLVLFLLALISLLLFVGGYAVYWRFMCSEKPSAALVPVQTQNGGNVYRGNQVPAMAKVAKTGKPKPTVAIRPVATIPAAELPKEEQAKVPDVPPAPGPDNVIRGPELADSAIVPPSRGETYIRSYLLPNGTVRTYQDQQREKFFGMNWKHLELEGGYGIGGKQVDAQATWLPLRLGNFHVGAQAESWMEPAGGMKGAASIRVRWEPFR